MKRQTLLVFVLSSCTAFSGVITEASGLTSWEFIIQSDNDVLVGTDGGYTNGTRLAFVYELDNKPGNLNLLQSSLMSLTGAGMDGFANDLRFPSNEVERIQFGYGLSHLMFTPENSFAAVPPAGERPYASWLGFETSMQASGNGFSNTATLSVGITGENTYAEEIQDWVHSDITGDQIFQGWDSQAPTELTVNLHFDHKRSIDWLKSTWDAPLQVDGFYEWGASLGNFRTDAFLGTHMRFGYNLPATHSSPMVQLGGMTNRIFDDGNKSDSDFSIYGFLGGRVYGVLHDISLDGPLFDDWTHSVDSKPLVVEGSLGLAARYDWIEVSFAHTIRSDEFYGQRNRSEFSSFQALIRGTF